MAQQHVSVSGSALIWLGAAVSVTEIMVGITFAPLGWQQGLAAIALGHLIGGTLFFAAGYIGAKTNQSAMQTVQISFGRQGSLLFSLANVLQLVGWTAIMIYTGAEICAALSGGTGLSFHFWCAAIGVLIAGWLLLGARHIGLVKTLVLAAMSVIVLWLSVRIFGADNAAAAPAGSMNFGTAVELAAVMPLSWLPLVSDYTRDSKRPFAVTLAAALAYGLAGCWMYALGLAAALFTGQTDISQILLFAGLSLSGILVVILSTVTTTFLDVYSAGVSANALSSKLPEKPFALAVTALGTLLAAALPVTQYENFLLLIGSVFAPMIAVQIADFFVMHRRQACAGTDFAGLALWLSGFALYRVLLACGWQSAVGLTFPVMAAVFILTVAVRNALTRRR